MHSSSVAMNNWYVRVSEATARYLIAAANHPYALLPFLLLAVSDSILPVLPAELMAVALMIIQPHRARLIGTGFAVAAAISALLLALVIIEARPYVLQLNPGLAEVLTNGNPIITDWGAPALAALSIFPDSPRISIAAATVAGLAPATIACAVLAGKLVLYLVLSALLHRLSEHSATVRKFNSPVARRIHRTLRRLSAFQRFLRRHARQQTRRVDRPR